MILKLIKLKLISIFSKPLLVLLFLVLLFDIYVGLLQASRASTSPYPTIDSPVANFGIELLSFYFLIYSLIPGNRFVNKSDMDFLFMLPVNEKEIIVTLSLVTFIYNLFLMATLNLLLALIIGYGSFLVITLFSLLISFIGNTLYKLRYIQRLFVSLILTLWFFSAYFGFPLSPLSMFKGYSIAYPILVIFTIFIVFFAIKKVSIQDLVQEGGLQSTKSIKSSLTFNSSSVLLTMLKKNLNIIELGGRIGAGGTQYLIARITIHYLSLGTIGLALVSYFFHVAIVSIFLEFMLLVNFAQASFINEPIWLNLSVMTPIQFARRYLLSKVISLYILFLPITVSFFLYNLEAGIGNLILPLTFIYLSSVLARFYPVSQSGNQAINIRRFIFSTVGLLLVFVITYLSLIFPIYTFIAVLTLTIPFLLSKNFWEKTFEKAISEI